LGDFVLLRLSALAAVISLCVPVEAQTFNAPVLTEQDRATLADARALEARGDDQRALEAYRLFLQAGHDTIDIALRFAGMARARLGATEARALLRDMTGTPALRLARATLADVAERRRALETFVTVHPDYAPGYALLALEYGHPQLADQPLHDRLRERELTSRFLGADAQGKLAESFVDATVLAAWLERAERRLAVLDAALSGAAAAPTAKFSRANSAWLVYLNMPEQPTEVRYRVGDIGPFLSTGTGGSIDMRTGRKMANVHFQMPVDTPAATIHLIYRDLAGRESLPYRIVFDPREQIMAASRATLDETIPGWANFADGQSHREWLYFNTLMYARCAIRKAEYGFNGPPDTEFPLPPCNLANPYASPADAQSAVKMPPDVRTISVRVTFTDGTAGTRVYQRPVR
jgi:hypothetical protein